MTPFSAFKVTGICVHVTCYLLMIHLFCLCPQNNSAYNLKRTPRYKRPLDQSTGETWSRSNCEVER